MKALVAQWFAASLLKNNSTALENDQLTQGRVVISLQIHQ